jgi:hypothetical protein
MDSIGWTRRADPEFRREMIGAGDRARGDVTRATRDRIQPVHHIVYKPQRP